MEKSFTGEYILNGKSGDFRDLDKLPLIDFVRALGYKYRKFMELMPVQTEGMDTVISIALYEQRDSGRYIIVVNRETWPEDKARLIAFLEKSLSIYQKGKVPIFPLT